MVAYMLLVKRGLIGVAMTKATNEDSNKTILFRGIAAIVAAVALVIVFNMTRKPDMKAIANEYADSSFCTVADDGSYIEIDTDPVDFGNFVMSGSMDAVKNINKELGFPESVYAQMKSTRAIDGAQNYEKDGVEVRWTYHPDNGLEVIYSVK